jgi:hypothetical protein
MLTPGKYGRCCYLEFEFYVIEIHSILSSYARPGGQTMLRKTLANLPLSKPYLVVTAFAQHHVTLWPPSHCRWLLGHSLFRDILALRFYLLNRELI